MKKVSSIRPAQTEISSVLICGLNPYFLEKPDVWFAQNETRILDASKTQSFFQDNILFCQKNQVYQLSQFLRKLDELGYEKVAQIAEPGEFARRGGIIDVFPINSLFASRVEFYGNIIEHIERLPIEIANGEAHRKLLLKRVKRAKIYSDLSGVKPNDYLVHLDHGIGRFVGLRTIAFSGSSQKNSYYVLEYAKGDKLYVPTSLERKLSRYVGFAEPVISRLSSPLWERTKRRVKEEAEKLARELLELYAKREIALRRPYVIDQEIKAALISSFPFEETPDQTQTMEEIEKDLQKERPMDRIVCGDVGFGKTEVALRTAVYASNAGHQTALVCPTTILAYQHYQTFSERLKNFPQEVALLSRLQTKRQQKEIISRLKNGAIDIVIGTHRILSPDVEFKNLGLLIIDDEQRFGVRQKEKLKKLKASLDVLSLSATPIPRTLYLALSSLKSISTIQTPPAGRTSVKTFVSYWDQKKIKEALTFELRRGGQIYYLHNRIETIGFAEKLLRRLIPEASIRIAHGRLSERELIEVMEGFRKKKIDILLATTIIENGLDLENANTLIVADATKLGLAQAHQIRGRIGRGHLQAYAYFFHGKNLTDAAKERLRALKQMQELGSGWRIALKDLEIRGAGNILGKEQSGAVNQVGLNLYCQMLSDAIEKLKGPITEPSMKI